MNILISLQAFHEQAMIEKILELSLNEEINNIYVVSSLMHEVDRDIKEQYEKINKVIFVYLNSIISNRLSNVEFVLKEEDLKNQDYMYSDILSSYRWLPISLRKTNDTISFAVSFYYDVLNFWTLFFQKNNIDSVILLNIEHSSLDSILIRTAKKFHVQSVITSKIVGDYVEEAKSFYALYDNITEKYIKLDKYILNNKKVFIIENTLVDGYNRKSQSIFNYVKKEYIKFDINNDKDIDLSVFLHYTQTDKMFHGKLSFKAILKQIPDKYGGYLLVMFFALIIGKFKSNMFSFDIHWWTYFKNYVHIKNMFRYYQSKSIKFDTTNKFIFFALHMEPEATTLARTIFSNQLVIIKSISNFLPKGWKLYVKDHPRQYVAFNNFKRYYFLAGIHKYRTKIFYNEIIKIPNVELINLNTNSKELIKYSEAVITINGSIILETIVQNKPLLLFAQYSTPFCNFKGVFDIKNSDDISKAIKKLNDGFNPNYKDLDIFINEYTYNVYLDKIHDYKITIESLI